MKKTYFFSIISILLVWTGLSIYVDSSIVLPSIFDVAICLYQLVISPDTYIAIGLTLSRLFMGITISFLFALGLASLAYRYQKVKEFIYPIVLIAKTIPTVSIIVLTLIWFGREGTITTIVSLVVFPILYSNILFGFNSIDKAILDDLKLIDTSYFNKLIYVYLPLIRHQIMESLKVTVSLGFKVSIMSELLAQIRVGIGREIYFNKINILTDRIFAWTIIIIFVSMLLDKSLIYLSNYLKD